MQNVQNKGFFVRVVVYQITMPFVGMGNGPCGRFFCTSIPTDDLHPIGYVFPFYHVAPKVSQARAGAPLL